MTQEDLPSRFAVDFAGAILLGIYRVREKLADGGMGSVWLGEDTNLGRKVVVKVPHVRFLGEPGFRARFTREITELVRLEHPNIVRILAQGTHEEIPFFVLQYLGGGSLEERLEAAGDGPRGVDVVGPWLSTIADTLDYVHGRGVVHRDVKPENILFDGEGHVFLSDFGVVKALDEDLKVTEMGTGVGSPRYMAPEQGLGKSVEGPADQYGLATTVYEAIAGRLPFEGESTLEILLNKQSGAPPDLAEFAPDLPTSCADAVMRGLAADPEGRFPSCREFADAFLRRAEIVDPPTKADVPRRRRPAVAATAAIIGAIVLTLGLATGWFSSGSADPNDDAADAEKAAYEVILLSPGAEPRRALRYRPVLGAEETVVTRIATEESKRLGEQDPTTVRLPRITLRMSFQATDIVQNDDISFGWKTVDAGFDGMDGLPPAAREALRVLTKSIEGRSGFGRESSRGIHRGFGHDSPPPQEAAVQPFLALITEIVSQLSTPLPEEPVGIGARWEVTQVKDHMEGIRITQTVTYEILSLGENEARIRMYIALAALSQVLEHPDATSDENIRLRKVHGDGEGDLVIDFDRLGDRSLRMTVESRAELILTNGEEETGLVVDRKLSFETDRE